MMLDCLPRSVGAGELVSREMLNQRPKKMVWRGCLVRADNPCIGRTLLAESSWGRVSSFELGR